jgi:hypothetical protein
MIAYLFPPVQAVSTLRWYHLYLESRRYFSHIAVLTSKHWQRMHQDPQLVLPIQPYLIPTYDLRRITLLRQNRPYLSSNIKKQAFLSRFLHLLDAFPFNLLVSDGGLVYIFLAYRKSVRLVKTQKTTHVLSSFRPYSDHVVAWLLKRRFPQLFWVADFRDLHLDPSRKALWQPKLQRWFNHQILKKANLVTTVSEGLAQHIFPFHPRVYVLRNGIDPIGLVQKERLLPNEKFTIAYTGSLYPGYQQPVFLFQTLNALVQKGKLSSSDFQLIYAGKDSAIWQEALKKSRLNCPSLDLGMCSLQDARAIQQHSDLNVLFSWSTPNLYGILTGKLYDYLAARKPIVALVNGSHDPELEQIIDETQSGKVFYKDQETALAAHILGLYQLWGKNAGLTPLMPAESLQSFSWPALMEGLAAALEIEPLNYPLNH